MVDLMDDLFALLGIEPKSVSTAKVETTPSVTSPVTEGGFSDSALKLDDWDLARGKECLARNKPLQMRGLTSDATADLFAVAYTDDPQPVEKCVDKRRLDYVKTLLESPECQSVRTSSVHNLAASEVATVKFAEGWANLLAKDKHRKANPSKKPKRDEVKEECDLISSVGDALTKASQEVEDLEETMIALGCGPGSIQEGKLDAREIGRLFSRSKDNPTLRRIMELAGRYRRVAQSKQRRKVNHGYDDVVGIELGGEIARLVPAELMMLADEDLEMDALRRLVERQSMCREYRGVEPVGKGPIIVCVDESGSMSGDPAANAKALSLAMAWVAHHQRRWCCLIGFAGSREGNKIVLHPRKPWNQNELLDWLEHFYSGGTVMDVPMDELPNRYWSELIAQGMPRGKTDLLLITDGIVDISDKMMKNFTDWKVREKVRLISLIIDSDPGQLAGVSDEVFRVNSMSLDESGIDRCLSI